jgi:hypothetical protein
MAFIYIVFHICKCRSAVICSKFLVVVIITVLITFAFGLTQCEAVSPPLGQS